MSANASSQVAAAHVPSAPRRNGRRTRRGRRAHRWRRCPCGRRALRGPGAPGRPAARPMRSSSTVATSPQLGSQMRQKVRTSFIGRRLAGGDDAATDAGHVALDVDQVTVPFTTTWSMPTWLRIQRMPSPGKSSRPPPARGRWWRRRTPPRRRLTLLQHAAVGHAPDVRRVGGDLLHRPPRGAWPGGCARTGRTEPGVAVGGERAHMGAAVARTDMHVGMGEHLTDGLRILVAMSARMNQVRGLPRPRGR